jgi:DNA-binding MarR family transcriptional regulator
MNAQNAVAERAISAVEWDAWHQFTAMRWQLDRALERQLQRNSGLSGPDYHVLITLFGAKNRRLRARDLGDLLAWEKSRVSHQVSRMESRGLVDRQECPEDARGTWIGITAEGRRTVLGAMRGHSESLRRYFLDVVTEPELELLRGISARVLGAIDPHACSTIEE